ncbi:MAG: inositol phosphorylceramide synthase [Planctomycetes bacterium]|nr:inositol phosphorylceramide synthase [Planctomycetota bacterium]
MSRLRLLRLLRPEEWLSVLFGAMLLFVAHFLTDPDFGLKGILVSFRRGVALSMGRQIPFFSSHMTFFLLLAGLTWLAFVARGLAARRWSEVGRRTRELGGLLRAYIPFLVCYVVYALLRDTIPHVRSETYDPALALMETDLFGHLASTLVYNALESPAMTWLLSKAYGSHFYVPPLVAFLLFFRGDRRPFRDFMLAIALSGFISYTGYLIVPVVGPRYALGEWQSIRLDQAGNAVLTFIDFWGETSRDCFPSMHAAWTVVAAVFLFRLSKPFFWVYLPVAAGLMLACLYFGFHWLIDMPAGVLVAVLSIALATGLHRWWYAHVADLVAPDPPPEASPAPQPPSV